ncbi:MAG: gfo/Idh/MocA family oxidoreductase, partial [Candidatus Ratteibacteria bacterium]
GIDDTAIDDCELYTMEYGKPVNRKIIVEPDPKMGRERAVINFVNTIRKIEEPFSKPEEAIILMKIIDSIYKSSEENKPIKVD